MGLMARFDKLEFNPRRDPRPPEPADGDPLARDADHWMNKADQAHSGGLSGSSVAILFSRGWKWTVRSPAVGLVRCRCWCSWRKFPEADLWSRKGLELFPSNGELKTAAGKPSAAWATSKQAHALCDGALQQTGQSGYRWLVRGEIMITARQDTDRYCFDKAQGNRRRLADPLGG